MVSRHLVVLMKEVEEYSANNVIAKHCSGEVCFEKGSHGAKNFDGEQHVDSRTAEKAGQTNQVELWHHWGGYRGPLFE